MKEIIIENSVYIALILGLIIGFFILSLLFKNMSKIYLLFLSSSFSFFSMISVLLFACFEELITFGSYIKGAVSTYGIYLFCPILIYCFYNKNDIKRIFDMFAVYVCPSMIFQRFRCILSGCCSGKTFFHTDFHWPTRESEIVFYFLVLLFFISEIEKEQIKKGCMFPVLMISYGLFRFVNEFFRIGNGIFHLAHIWSILSIIVGYSIYSELNKRA